jgi:hypothetical protein
MAGREVTQWRMIDWLRRLTGQSAVPVSQRRVSHPILCAKVPVALQFRS